MDTVTTKHSTAREQMLARISLPVDVIARRWEPLAPGLAEVLHDWSVSGELSQTLASIQIESEGDLDL
jgi:hypothetical protein